LLHEPGGTETKTDGTTNSPKRTSVAPLRPEARKKEKGRGGRRNPLIRLDSAKEIQGFDLDFIPPDLDFVPTSLDFAPENLEILHHSRVGPTASLRADSR
jgi:hypothetical protein